MPHAIHVPPSPADRPHVTRRTSRVLLADHEGHVLLFRDSDLGLDPVPHWWMTPGGGIDPGEDDRTAAAREVLEETGLVVAPEDVIGPIATRRVVHGYSDVVVDQVEVFFGVRTDRFAPSPAGYTEEEAACIIDEQWLSRSAVADLDEPVWPGNLVEIWDHWDAMAVDPDLSPLDLPDVEESTVPAGDSDQPA